MASKDLSKDQVYETWRETEPCRHGTRFWCDDCVHESWERGLSVGFEQGVELAIQHVGKLSGDAYLAHKTDRAELYRAIVDYLKTEKQKREDRDKTDRKV